MSAASSVRDSSLRQQVKRPLNGTSKTRLTECRRFSKPRDKLSKICIAVNWLYLLARQATRPHDQAASSCSRPLFNATLYKILEHTRIRARGLDLRSSARALLIGLPGARAGERGLQRRHFALRGWTAFNRWLIVTTRGGESSLMLKGLA